MCTIPVLGVIQCVTGLHVKCVVCVRLGCRAEGVWCWEGARLGCHVGRCKVRVSCWEGARSGVVQRVCGVGRVQG